MRKAKRANGEGYYQKLKSGTWLGQIMDGYTVEGKKNVVSFTAPTKGEVQQKIAQYRINKAEGILPLKTGTSFSEWADCWYEDYESQVQASTYSGYQYTLKILKAYFKNRPLTEIKQIHINGFINSLLRDGASRSKISKCKAMLVQIFDAAEENNLVVKNPARHAKVIRDLNNEEGKKDAFREDEVQKLLAALPDDLLGNSIRTLLGSGLRVQELLALTPEDIMPDGSAICVNKAIKMVDGKPVLGPPKSKKGNRNVPIPEMFRPYVKGILRDGGRAFIWTSGRSNLLYSVGTFRRNYYEAIKAVGVRKLSPHCCRHTYITWLQAKGVPIELIARLAGHSDITTTDGYTHTSQETLAQAVAVLGTVGAAQSKPYKE